jgi:predicted nucleotide-binding protein
VFFGTVRRGKAILLVERGAEMPSDWGGLLYVQFSPTAEMASSCGELGRAVDKALARAV